MAELMYADFLVRAQATRIFNQLSKVAGHVGGMLTMPVVLRISVGAKYGAQHSAGLDRASDAHPRLERRSSGYAVTTPRE